MEESQSLKTFLFSKY